MAQARVNLLRAVIWDLDGVLLDSYEAHYRTWQKVLVERGIPAARDVFERSFGMNNHATTKLWLRDRWTPALAEEIAARKEALFREEMRTQARAHPGAVDWLARLRRAGWRQALGSSAPQANIDVALDALDIRRYLDAVCSGEGLPSKPDPTLFLNAARALGVEPARCVVVEDAPAGVAAAKAAGMRCMALTTTHGADAFGAADVIAPGLDALPADVFDRLVPNPVEQTHTSPHR